MRPKTTFPAPLWDNENKRWIRFINHSNILIAQQVRQTTEGMGFWSTITHDSKQAESWISLYSVTDDQWYDYRIDSRQKRLFRVRKLDGYDEENIELQCSVWSETKNRYIEVDSNSFADSDAKYKKQKKCFVSSSGLPATLPIFAAIQSVKLCNEVDYAWDIERNCWIKLTLTDEGQLLLHQSFPEADNPKQLSAWSEGISLTNGQVLTIWDGGAQVKLVWQDQVLWRKKLSRLKSNSNIDLYEQYVPPQRWKRSSKAKNISALNSAELKTELPRHDLFVPASEKALLFWPEYWPTIKIADHKETPVLNTAVAECVSSLRQTVNNREQYGTVLRYLLVGIEPKDPRLAKIVKEFEREYLKANNIHFVLANTDYLVADWEFALRELLSQEYAYFNHPVLSVNRKTGALWEKRMGSLLELLAVKLSALATNEMKEDELLDLNINESELVLLQEAQQLLDEDEDRLSFKAQIWLGYMTKDGLSRLNHEEWRKANINTLNVNLKSLTQLIISPPKDQQLKIKYTRDEQKAELKPDCKRIVVAEQKESATRLLVTPKAFILPKTNISDMAYQHKLSELYKIKVEDYRPTTFATEQKEYFKQLDILFKQYLRLVPFGKQNEFKQSLKNFRKHIKNNRESQNHKIFDSIKLFLEKIYLRLNDDAKVSRVNAATQEKILETILDFHKTNEFVCFQGIYNRLNGCLLELQPLLITIEERLMKLRHFILTELACKHLEKLKELKEKITLPPSYETHLQTYYETFAANNHWGLGNQLDMKTIDDPFLRLENSAIVESFRFGKNTFSNLTADFFEQYQDGLVYYLVDQFRTELEKIDPTRSYTVLENLFKPFTDLKLCELSEIIYNPEEADAGHMVYVANLTEVLTKIITDYLIQKKLLKRSVKLPRTIIDEEKNIVPMPYVIQLLKKQDLQEFKKQLSLCSYEEINQPDAKGNHALMHAIKNRDFEKVKILLNLPFINLNQVNHARQTLLNLALVPPVNAELVTLVLVKLSIRKELIDNLNAESLILHLKSDHSEDALKIKNMLRIYEEIQTASSQKDRASIILKYVLDNDLEATRFLLKLDIGIKHFRYTDYEGNQNNSLLHMAAACGHTEMCELLIKAGFNIKQQNEKGITPCQMAEDNEHPKTVEKLIYYITRQDKKNDKQQPLTSRVIYQTIENFGRHHRYKPAKIQFQQTSVFPEIKRSAREEKLVPKDKKEQKPQQNQLQPVDDIKRLEAPVLPEKADDFDRVTVMVDKTCLYTVKPKPWWHFTSIWHWFNSCDKSFDEAAERKRIETSIKKVLGFGIVPEIKIKRQTILGVECAGTLVRHIHGLATQPVQLSLTWTKSQVQAMGLPNLLKSLVSAGISSPHDAIEVSQRPDYLTQGNKNWGHGYHNSTLNTPALRSGLLAGFANLLLAPVYAFMLFLMSIALTRAGVNNNLSRMISGSTYVAFWGMQGMMRLHLPPVGTSLENFYFRSDFPSAFFATHTKIKQETPAYGLNDINESMIAAPGLT